MFLRRTAIGLVLALLVALPATVHTEQLPISPQVLKTLLPASGAYVLEYQADDYRAEGKIEGCGVSFQYLFRDWAYRDNAPTLAYGSVVYFWKPPKRPYLAFRIGIDDLKLLKTTVGKISAKPNYAYIEINGTSLAGREYKQLRFKGGRILNTVYLDDKKLTLMGKLSTLKSLVVAFNRKKGSTDLRHELVSVPSAPNKINRKPVNLKNAGCFINLIKQNQKR